MQLNVLLQCTLINCLWYCNDADNDRLIAELKMLAGLTESQIKHLADGEAMLTTVTSSQHTPS